MLVSTSEVRWSAVVSISGTTAREVLAKVYENGMDFW